MASASDIIVLRARFPQFATVADPDIANAYDQADVFLDEAVWIPRDWPLARLYWAAHMLTLYQQFTTAAATETGGTGSTDLYVKTVRYGEKLVSYAERMAGADTMVAGPGEALLATTIPGQLFLQLRTRNIFAIAVV